MSKDGILRISVCGSYLEDANGAVRVGRNVTPQILRRGVMHDDRRRALLGFQQKSGRQLDANIFFGMEQRKKFRLVFQVRACGISEAVAGTAVLLVEEIANVFGVFGSKLGLIFHATC